jgi:predicted O-methyltransferase YrrM/mRNA-degrading endonuclease toxin of MazEF toxin-antitoxin module
MEHIKDFDSWNEYKKILNKKQDCQLFREWEIWWCSHGLNIGYEIDGKNELFDRPVLIFQKHNNKTFLGIPLTSSFKENNKWYFKIKHAEEKEFILNLSQIRTLSSKRLIRRIAKLSDENISCIELYLEDLLFKRKTAIKRSSSSANGKLTELVYYIEAIMQISQNIQLVMNELLSLCNSESWKYEQQTDFLQNEEVNVSSEEKVLAWNISPETGKYLFDLVVKHKPTRILELGTSTGYSTLWLGAAAQSYGGTIDTVDYYDRKIEIAKKYIQKAGLDNMVTVHHTRIATFLESVKSEEYSFVFLDADKNNYHNYLPELLRVMKQGSLLVVDNAINYRDRMKEFVMICESSNNLKVELLEVGSGLLFVSKQN